MSHRNLVALVLLFAVHACARAKPAGPAQPAPTPAFGRLQVAVHPADRPTQPMFEAYVYVRMAQREEVRRVTNEYGLVTFDSLPAGDYDVLVRRLGYGEARGTVPVSIGCRTDAEAYLAMAYVGIDPPPPRRGKVTVTTC